MADDSLRLFGAGEQEAAVKMFLARIFCYEEIAPCDHCQDFVDGSITERAYDALRSALARSNVPFSDRALFFGALQMAAVTMTPNDKDDDR